MRAYLSAFAALAVLSAPVPVQATDSPLELDPSSKWVVNYADDSCRLIRMFGEGDQQVRLEFRVFAPEQWFWVLISGKPIDPRATGWVQVASRFDPDTKDVAYDALSGKLDETTPAIMFMSSFMTYDAREALSKAGENDPKAYQRPTPSSDPMREAQVDALEIKVAARNRLTLRLGSMNAPMNAVRTCLDNLLGSWGLDAQAQKTLRQPAVPASAPAKWLNSDDYPPGMVDQGISDVVNFCLTVSAAGMPTACDVLTMDARPEFIKASCNKLMQRARFQPALDAHGKPIASIYVGTVIWEAN